MEEYGMWDQLRVDQGKEWTLMLYVQEQLSNYRRNITRAPHLQSSSKQVHYATHCMCMGICSKYNHVDITESLC